MNDTNKAIITGKIVHLYIISTQPARAILTIHTNGTDNPKVFVTDRAAIYVINRCNVGDFVTVEANLQSSLKAKVGKTVTVFAEKVRKNCTQLAPENKFYLAGEIVSVRTNTECNVSSIIVRTNVNNRISTIPITFYNPDHKLFAIISDNPTLAISGRIQTVSHDYGNGKKIYHQNYVADFPRNE